MTEGPEELTLPLVLHGSSEIFVDEGHRAVGVSFRQTLFNVINMFVGIGLLSLPYAIRMGGWTALGALAAMVSVFCLSGQLIVSAFGYMGDRPRTYPELGKCAVGRHGGTLVATISLTELFGGCCIILLIVWEQLGLLLPVLPESSWGGSLSRLQLSALVSFAFLLPALFIGGFRRLSSLSLLGSASSVLMTLAVLALLPLDPHRAELTPEPGSGDLPGHTLASWGVAQSVGIFAMSASAHSSLPALRAGMHQPSRFPAVLSLAFACMAALYAGVGGIGYWYYGDSVSPVITADLARAGPYASGAAPRLDRPLAALILLTCATKIPAFLLVMQDLVLAVAGLAPTAIRPRPAALLLMRASIFASAVALSYAAASVLGAFISLVGGFCSLTSSLLLPVAFYTLVAWRDLGLARRTALLALLVAGSGLAASVTAQNISNLIHGPALSGAPANSLLGAYNALTGQ